MISLISPYAAGAMMRSENPLTSEDGKAMRPESDVRDTEKRRAIGSRPAVCVGVRFLQDLNAVGCDEALKRASLGEAPAGGVPTAQGARVRQRGHHSICFKPESAASFALAIAALTSPPVSCRNLRRLVEACRGLAARSSSSLS